MEPTQTEIALHRGVVTGIGHTINILDACLKRQLHPDFAMDRVIRSSLEEVRKSFIEFQTAYKEVNLCPLYPSTNPTPTRSF